MLNIGRKDFSGPKKNLLGKSMEECPIEWGKKFNLDCPNAFASYWRDLRRKKSCFPNVIQDDGLWWFGVALIISCILYLEDIMYKYQDNLKKHLSLNLEGKIPFSVGLGYISHNSFNNAMIQTSKYWGYGLAAIFSLISLIENLWGILARKVWERGKQFFNANDLKVAILQILSQIPTITLENWSMTVSNRSYDLILARGRPIKY